ncbi:hypothetical protein [Geomonas anaerohicana]|uniref:Uncharacterized protein n=1 Tax=Geomonas anaerohicana TaxID=2798583 RepID=A0ABS0YBB4_9BACT|nr:hypothetical protein [Geomonas anaerohicana]MBJ6749556.1 hypothetical protein [Geomonas anaerohicana]
MSIMNNHLLSAVGSFGLGTAHSMVMKAWREYQRCVNAGSDDDHRDAAINCAITLWHLNDWVWNGIAVSARDKLEVKQLLGVTGRRLEKDDLVKWAVTSCPELKVCQSICNGTKHVVCLGITEARLTPADVQKPAEEGKVLGRLEIVDAGGVRDGIQVLYKGFEFWHHHATNDNVLL